MSAAFDPTTSQVITPSPKSPKRWPWIVAVVAAFAAGATTTMVVMSGSSDEKETEPAQEALFENSESPTPFVVEEEPPPLPSPEDFAIELRILSKQCFGSAGCNVSYSIEPVYLGSEPLDDVSATVTYEVLGGDSGPQINSFTLDGDTITYREEEFISIPSSSTELKIEVTDVF